MSNGSRGLKLYLRQARRRKGEWRRQRFAFFKAKIEAWGREWRERKETIAVSYIPTYITATTPSPAISYRVEPIQVSLTMPTTG